MTTQTFLESLLSLPPGAEVSEGDLASMVDQEFARLPSSMPAQDMMSASQMAAHRRTARVEARSSASPDELDRKTLETHSILGRFNGCISKYTSA